MSSSSARSAASPLSALSPVCHDWHLGPTCLFFERFIRLFPSALHFHPESLFAGLSCRAHQRSAVRSLPPSRKAKVGDGEELKVATRADDHEAWQCRCYAVDCQHIVQLHMALLTVAGYAHVDCENWLTHFNGELDARREDWPTLEAALQREEDEALEEKQRTQRLPPQAAKKKRKLPRIEQNDDDQHPLTHLHYHTLSPSIKALLLYLHSSWMLLDSSVHDLISEQHLQEEEPYGVDDDGNRYFLYLHPEWNEGRVHLYRERRSDRAEQCRFELLASNRDELEIAASILMSQPGPSTQALIHRITSEAIAELEKVGRLLERRQRRAAREAIDYRNILVIGEEEGGGRTRRIRKEVNYKELDEGEGLEVEEAAEVENKRPLQRKEDKSDDEEEVYQQESAEHEGAEEEEEEEEEERVKLQDGKEGRAEEEEHVDEQDEEERMHEPLLPFVPSSPRSRDAEPAPHDPDERPRSRSPATTEQEMHVEVEAPLPRPAESSSHLGRSEETAEAEHAS